MGDQLREEERLALETLLANIPQSRAAKSNSLELTPSNTPQLSPATTPANRKNRLQIGNHRVENQTQIATGPPLINTEDCLRSLLSCLYSSLSGRTVHPGPSAVHSLVGSISTEMPKLKQMSSSKSHTCACDTCPMASAASSSSSVSCQVV